MLVRTSLLILFLLNAASCFADEDNKLNEHKPRSFNFSYSAKVQKLPTNSKVKVWVPLPSSSEFQSIEIIDKKFPASLKTGVDKKYGNQIGYFETTTTDTGEVPFSICYKVERRESKSAGASRKLSDEQKSRFLGQNKLVPTTGKPLKLIDDRRLPTDSFDLAHELYDVVEKYLAYDKTKPGYGNGDVLWACSSRTGNCTDFHSLFISLARSQNLPARFEIGFPIPAGKSSGTIDGYHCWAWFHSDQHGWVPVDISEADKHPEMKSYYFGRLTPDRIAFSTGRDIELVPESKSVPLNYFVFPHVEVDGKVWPKNNIATDFSFKDTKVPSEGQSQ